MTDPATLDRANDLLMRAALVISSFRNRLKVAGYVFPEPPDTARIIADIDSHMQMCEDQISIEKR